jgi:hypothetical protein
MKLVQAWAARFSRWIWGGRRLATLALAVAIIAVAAPPSHAAPQTNAEGLVSILAPTSRVRVRDPVTVVRLRLGAHADPATLKVVLNGRDVTGRLQGAGPGARGRQRVGLLRHHDLVPGRNRLTVSVTARNGRRHDTDVVGFVSDLHRLGSTLNLAARAPQALVTRVWQPAASEYAIDVADPATAGGMRAFQGTSGQQFQVLVLDAATLAPVSDDSFSYLGPAWTRPGPAPADPLHGLLTTPAPGASTSPIQECQRRGGCTVVVQSLSAFGTPQCAIPGPCSQPTRPGDSLATIGGTKALNAIGVTADGAQMGYSLVTRIFLDGTFPGVGGGHERLGCYDCTQNPVVVPSRNGAGDTVSRSVGRISGVLVADQLNDLGFWPYDFAGDGWAPLVPLGGDLPYTIGAGTAQDPVRIGAQSFTADPAVTDGFLVVSSAGGTNPTWTAKTFEGPPELDKLHQYLESFDPDSPLVIRTIGKPIIDPDDFLTFPVWDLLQDWNITSELFSSLTGDDDMVVLHASKAAAIGLPGDQVPTAVEASSLLYRAQRGTAPPGPTRLTGVLRRDNRGVWRSAVQTPVYGATPAGQSPVSVNTALSETALDPAVVPFPAFTSTNQRNAYAWVGSWILNAKKYDPSIDVRAAYSQLSSAALLSASADTITMPSGPPPAPFTAADLKAVAAQVQQELLYASRVVKVIEDLTTMMSAYGAQAGNDLAAAVDQVKGNFTTVTLPTSPLVADLELIFSVALQVAAVFAAADGGTAPGDDHDSKGDAIGLAGDAYDLITGLIANGGGTKRSVTHGDQALVVAATLAADLGNALWDGDAALTTMRGLITSDWGKTRALGTAIGPSPAGTRWDVLGQQEWFTASMGRSVKTEAFRLLLPAAYDNNRVLVLATKFTPPVKIDAYYYETGFTHDPITPFTHAFKPDGHGGWTDIPPGAYHTKYMVYYDSKQASWPCAWLYSLSTMAFEKDSIGQRIYYSKTYPGPFVNDLFVPWQTLKDTDHLGVWQPGFYVNRMPHQPIDPNHEPWPDKKQCDGS